MSPSTFTITYSKEGTFPPVFVAGSFSSTPWEPQEMEPDSGENPRSFSKTIFASAGTYQYKFRLGTGDWWVVDADLETTTDDQGNVNNVLVIQKDGPAPESSAFSPAQQEMSARPIDRTTHSQQNVLEAGRPELPAAAPFPETSVKAYDRSAPSPRQATSAAATKITPEGADFSHDLPTPPISERGDGIETKEMLAETSEDRSHESKDQMQMSDVSPARKPSRMSPPSWDRNGMILFAVAVVVVPLMAWNLSR